MRQALSTLQRIREIEKKTSRQSFALAERNRIQQEVRVESLVGALQSSREHAAAIAGEPAWHMHHTHAWRLKTELDLRRERMALHQRTVEAQARQQVFREASRKVRVVELAIERHDAEEALVEQRKDNARIDEIAGNRWWRRSS
jgi:flagellar export protein FliJ